VTYRFDFVPSLSRDDVQEEDRAASDSLASLLASRRRGGPRPEGQASAAKGERLAHGQPGRIAHGQASGELARESGRADEVEQRGAQETGGG
jgi:hypothetical protein